MYIPIVLRQNKDREAIVVGDGSKVFDLVRGLSENGFIVKLFTPQPVNDETIKESGVRDYAQSIQAVDEDELRSCEDVDLVASVTDSAEFNDEVLRIFRYRGSVRYSSTPSEYANAHLLFPGEYSGFSLCAGSLDGDGQFREVPVSPKFKDKLSMLGEKTDFIGEVLTELYQDSERYQRFIESVPELFEFNIDELKSSVLNIVRRADEDDGDIKVGFLRNIDNAQLKAQLMVDELKRRNPTVNFSLEGIPEDFSYRTDESNYKIFNAVYYTLCDALMQGKIDIGFLEGIHEFYLKPENIREWRNVLPRGDFGYLIVTKGSYNSVAEIFEAENCLCIASIIDHNVIKNYLRQSLEAYPQLNKKIDELKIDRHYYDLPFIVRAFSFTDFGTKPILVSKDELVLSGLDEKDFKERGFKVFPTDFSSMQGAGRFMALTLKGNQKANALLDSFSRLESEDKTEELERMFIKLALKDYYLGQEHFPYAFCREKDGKYKLKYAWAPGSTKNAFWGETEWLEEGELIKEMERVTDELKHSYPST